MELPFEPKIGQLVCWEALEVMNPNSKLGIVTNVLAYDYVEVTFIHNDWILRINTRSLKLLNDVED